MTGLIGERGAVHSQQLQKSREGSLGHMRVLQKGRIGTVTCRGIAHAPAKPSSAARIGRLPQAMPQHATMPMQPADPGMQSCLDPSSHSSGALIAGFQDGSICVRAVIIKISTMTQQKAPG